jgi:hypothetical protein
MLTLNLERYTSDMLSNFWSIYQTDGVHPHDSNFINASNSLRWNWPTAKRRVRFFESNSALHGLLHLGLTPQPFIGNIETASIYILMANPGLDMSDYDDDFGNEEHIKACHANLRQTGQGFYPLLPASINTGTGRYWSARVKTLEKDISDRLEISPANARSLLIKELAVIEAGPYHSKKFPGDWSDRLPSSRAARRFVRKTLIPRTVEDKALILIQRRSAFWRIPETHRTVIRRAPNQAQLTYFLASERNAIVEFLVRKFEA